jgi:hypothetical protein
VSGLHVLGWKSWKTRVVAVVSVLGGSLTASTVSVANKQALLLPLPHAPGALSVVQLPLLVVLACVLVGHGCYWTQCTAMCLVTGCGVACIANTPLEGVLCIPNKPTQYDMRAQLELAKIALGAHHAPVTSL